MALQAKTTTPAFEEMKFPEWRESVLLQPAGAKTTCTAREIIQEALSTPLDRPSLGTFLTFDDRVVVIVNDATRPTPSGLVLQEIAPSLNPAHTTILIATGAHHGTGKEERKMILGPVYQQFWPCVQDHDAKFDPMTFVGATERGTEVLINKKVTDADKVIVIGGVEPHYFAGFSGGRKSLIPGVAGYKTIVQNHKLALSSNASTLALTGNPVHEDMVEAAELFEQEKIFSIQTVLDRDRNISGVAAGSLKDSFEACVPLAREAYGVIAEKRADVVVTVAPFPMDIDLYQAQKAIDNGRLILKKGGILILISSCREGIGPDTFYNLLARESSPLKVLEHTSRNYKLGYHKAAKIAELASHSQIWAITDLPSEILEDIFISSKPDLQTALKEARALSGVEARIALMPEGTVTVPLVLE